MNVLPKKYSKAKAAGNHVVFTGDEVLPVPYTMMGLVVDQGDFGFLRIQGRPVICTGFHAHFTVPAGDRAMKMSVVLCAADGTTFEQTRLRLDGIVEGNDIVFNPAVKMPTGSLWKLLVNVDDGDEDYWPEGLTVTYQLRYSNGFSRSNYFVTTEQVGGIGFYDIGGTFNIQ